jgi:hypothetical protein
MVKQTTCPSHVKYWGSTILGEVIYYRKRKPFVTPYLKGRLFVTDAEGILREGRVHQ